MKEDLNSAQISFRSEQLGQWNQVDHLNAGAAHSSARDIVISPLPQACCYNKA